MMIKSSNALKCNKLIGFLTLNLLVTVAISQVTPEEALPNLMRGINLGNTLEPPIEGQWRETDPEEWSDNGPAEEYYFDAFVEAGFKSIRIPVTWHTHVSDTLPYTIDRQWLNRVEEIIDWALSRGMWVVLNSHHDDWLKQSYSDQNKARFDSIWSQIASEFQDKPERLLFEILNEPHDLSIAQVNDLNSRILHIIRQTNPTRIVFFSGARWANSNDLLSINIPNDSYVMGYYHSYDPWPFAGEGQGIWGTSTHIADMQARMASVQEWSQSNNVPVVISEFGTDTLCDYNSRMKYIATYVEEALKHNLGFMVWDDGGTFNVYRRPTNTWHDTKEIFINFSENNPTNLVLTNTDNRVTLNWTTRTLGADSIRIEHRNYSSSFTLLASVDGLETSYVHENAVIGDNNYYRVIAYRNDSAFYSYPQMIGIVANESEREPFHGYAYSIPASFQAEDFDKGGYGLSYSKKFPTKSNNIYREGNGIDIGEFGNGYALIENEAGKWFSYSISVPASKQYEIGAYIGSESDEGKIKFQAGNTIKSLSVHATGSHSNLEFFSTYMELSAGEQILKLFIGDGGDFIIDSISILEYTDPNMSASVSLNPFTVFPNPSAVSVTIHSETFSSGLFKIRIVDFSGAIIKAVEVASLPASIPVEDLSEGIYIIELFSSNGVFRNTFIKN